MIQRCGFVDSDVLSGDYRYYNSEVISTPFRYLVTTGLQRGGDNLQVFPGSLPLSVAINPGFAWINGRWYLLKDDGLGDGRLPVILEAAVQFPRIDHIVLRLEFGDVRAIRPLVVKGEEAVSPAPPALVREDGEEGAYDICLARVQINPGATMIEVEDVTDTRFDEALCGLADFAPNPEYDPHLAQWNADLGAFRDDWAAQYGNIVSGMQAFYDEMPAEWAAWIQEQQGKGYVPMEDMVAQKVALSAVPGLDAENVQAAVEALFQRGNEVRANLIATLGNLGSTSTIDENISSLAADKEALAANLTAKRVPALASESNYDLVTKVGEISTGGEINYGSGTTNRTISTAITQATTGHRLTPLVLMYKNFKITSTGSFTLDGPVPQLIIMAKEEIVIEGTFDVSGKGQYIDINTMVLEDLLPAFMGDIKLPVPKNGKGGNGGPGMSQPTGLPLENFGIGNGGHGNDASGQRGQGGRGVYSGVHSAQSNVSGLPGGGGGGVGYRSYATPYTYYCGGSGASIANAGTVGRSSDSASTYNEGGAACTVDTIAAGCNVTFIAPRITITGQIVSNGLDGKNGGGSGSGSGPRGGGGSGGAGGGGIDIFYREKYINTGTISASGGLGGAGGDGNSLSNGVSGTSGTIRVRNIDDYMGA